MISSIDLKPHRIVHERLLHWADSQPDAPFVRCASDWLNYGETAARVNRLAAGLQGSGIEIGDRVAVILPNRLEMVLTIFALARIGAIQVPLNVYLKGRFLSYQLNDCSARFLVTDRAGVSELSRLEGPLASLETVIVVGESDAAACARDHELPRNLRILDFIELAECGSAPHEVDRSRSDIVSIMYTSGTTGMPKGCMLSHGYYMAIPWGWYDEGLLLPGDRMITAMPLFHAGGGVIFLMSALQGGLAIQYEAAFSASTFLDACRDAKATVALGVAATGYALLATPPTSRDCEHDLRWFQVIPMAPADQERFEARFGVPVQSKGYGQTEVNPVTLAGPAAFGEKRATMGRPLAQFEISLRDEHDEPVAPGEIGELCVRPRETEIMFQGYWGKSEATMEAWKGLWHHTGDLAWEDEDGYLTFAGRRSDSLRRRGENVSALEVEEAVRRHPGIEAAAIHPVPSDLGEDDIKLCAVPTPSGPPTPQVLFDYLVENLPYFAIPRYVEWVDELPMTATGRVMKYELAEHAARHDWDFEALGFRVEKDRRRGS